MKFCSREFIESSIWIVAECSLAARKSESVRLTLFETTTISCCCSHRFHSRTNCSESDVEAETNWKWLWLLLGNDSFEGEACGESSGDWAVDLVLEDSVDLADLVDLELAGGVTVESVQVTESSLDDSGGPVEGELGADNLWLSGSVVHVKEEFSEW